jgi:hypothetical protein
VPLTGGRDCPRIRRSYRLQVETIRHTPLRYHLFDVFSQRHERGANIVTGNPPFDEWIGVFGSERCDNPLSLPTVSVSAMRVPPLTLLLRSAATIFA